MSLWTSLSDILARLQIAEAVGGFVDRVVDSLRAMTAGSPESRRVAFTVSLIALSAKMAKADGVVTEDEVSVVRRLFEVPEGERRNVARLFNLAKQDVAGFDVYAARLRRLYEDDDALMEDILDGLFTIAAADGHVHEREADFLATVAAIFQIGPTRFARIEARHVEAEAADPYVILGLPRGSPPAEAKRAWRRLAAENHPDRLVARGVPEECMRLAHDRMAAINAAYEKIERDLVA